MDCTDTNEETYGKSISLGLELADDDVTHGSADTMYSEAFPIPEFEFPCMLAVGIPHSEKKLRAQCKGAANRGKLVSQGR